MQHAQEVRRSTLRRACRTCGDGEVEDEPPGRDLLIERDDRVETRGGPGGHGAGPLLADPRRLDPLHRNVNERRPEEDVAEQLRLNGREAERTLGGVRSPVRLDTALD